jgi:dTDP-4-amino-4,6-dideoxygalactose transaminase
MKIPIEGKYVERFYKSLDKVFDSNFLSHGPMNKKFEKEFGKYTNLNCATVSNGGMGLYALLKYVNVENKDVIVPTNTFIATPRAVEMAGGNIIFADCSKEDLCIHLEDIIDVITPTTKAIVVVHIGGHIDFDIEDIAKYCKGKHIALIEDCAHAHGASYKGSSAGSWGIGGAYSFYATKTMPLGEGGMVVSSNKDVTEWIKRFRNYGKDLEGRVVAEGFNLRMNEITAAFGITQLERLPKILKFKRRLAKKYNKKYLKDKVYDGALHFPKGMESGYYKYIIYNKENKIKDTTGLVYGELCHKIMKREGKFPKSEWITKNHKCLPIWYGYKK